MVPQRPEEIAPAMRAKLAALDRRLAADSASLPADEGEGRSLVDALRRASAEVTRELEDAAASEPENER